MYNKIYRLNDLNVKIWNLTAESFWASGDFGLNKYTRILKMPKSATPLLNLFCLNQGRIIYDNFLKYEVFKLDCVEYVDGSSILFYYTLIFYFVFGWKI